MPEYYESSGKYSVCWCGIGDNRVYVAWCQKEAIGYFREGSEAERKQAAQSCCKEHFISNNKKAG